MGTAERLARLLLQWWHSSVRSLSAPEWLASDATFDSGLELLHGDEIVARVKHFCAWTDIEILASFGNDVQAALVYEAFDPGTLRRRREAWVVSVVEERITRILAVDMVSYNHPRSPTT